MKKVITLIAIFLTITAVLSCSKTNGVNGKVTIEGRWLIKKDSVTSTIGPYAHGTNYVGTAADYFDFRPDNKLYIKEGTERDTFVYTITSDTTMTFGGVGVNLNMIPLRAFMSSFTASRVTLNIVPTLWNPGGNTTRLTILTR
ncbi:MAG TPA: hypothetical protein VHC47_07945 [Mucilaginibacter sp.]|nr:hypothetical protein [Mucilaginibacter sp.]